MKTAFRKSLERDLKKLKNDQQMLGRIRKAIEAVEAIAELKELSSVKKLRERSQITLEKKRSLDA